MIQRIVLITAIIIITATGAAVAGEQEERLYNSILKEDYTPRKKKIAEELGRMGTADARAKLLKLLGERLPWNRSAAVQGLFALPDASAGQELLTRMLSDHMVGDEISAGFAARIAAYHGFLAGKYRAMTDQKERERIIRIMGSSKSSRGEAFLKGIIDDGGSPDRECAFRDLVKHYGSGNYEYIKGRRDAAVFRVHALTHLVEKGTPEELPIFMDILQKREEAKNRLIAYKAVNRWGDESLKDRVFMESLRESDENLVQGGIYVFTGVRSDAARKELCRIVKKGAYQMTRMAAALRLKEYTTPDIIPPLVVILRESYVQRERGGADIFATIITFGITSVFDDISQKRQRSSFDGSKKEIADHLKRITGADNGVSYGLWYEWAILNGHTVMGDNIIRHLFSGYRSKREKAMDHAIRLLGYSSGRDFYAKNGSFANDTELSLALARMLIGKGFLRDEE